jgi:hypothetical protein
MIIARFVNGWGAWREIVPLIATGRGIRGRVRETRVDRDTDGTQTLTWWLGGLTRRRRAGGRSDADGRLVVRVLKVPVPGANSVGCIIIFISVPAAFHSIYN